MGKRGDESDYESLRDTRVSENKARMEMLGLRRAKEELNEMAAAAAPTRRPWTHKQYATGPPRRSARLNGQAVQHKALPLKGVLGKVTAVAVEEADEEEEEEEEDEQQQAAGWSTRSWRRHCRTVSEGMGAVYDPVHGEIAISAEEIVRRG